MPTLLRSRETTRAVEDSHHDAFAEHRGQHADPQVDGVTTDRQFDTAVLRQPPLGNIEVGHDFDARGDGEGQVTWRRHHFVQHAVRLDANPELVFKRLEVHVAGVVLDGQQQHHVEQLADRAHCRPAPRRRSGRSRRRPTRPRPA